MEQPPVLGATTLLEALTRYDRLFVDSRYSFEHDQPLVDGPIGDLVRLVRWFGNHLEAMPREMIFDESELLPEHPGRVVGDTIVLNPDVALPDESIVQIEVVDRSLPGEDGVIENGIIRLDWSGALSEGTKVVVKVTGKLLPLEELDPAFWIGDRSVNAADFTSKANGEPSKVEDQ